MNENRDMLAMFTEEAFDAPARPLRVSRTVRRLAAVAACATVMILAAQTEPVQAAVRQLMVYLPGFSQQAEEGETEYAYLPEEISFTENGCVYTIKSLSRAGGRVYLAVDKQGVQPEDEPERPYVSDVPEEQLYLQVRLLSEGRVLSGVNCSSAMEDINGKRSFSEVGEYEAKRWDPKKQRDEYFEIGNALTVELDGIAVKVELTELDPEKFGPESGFACEDAGIALRVLPLNGQGSQFALLGQRADGSCGRIELNRATAYDEAGNAYEVERMTNINSNGEYRVINCGDARIVRLEVSAVLEYYNSDALEYLPTFKVKNPAPGETVELEGITLPNDVVEGGTLERAPGGTTPADWEKVRDEEYTVRLRTRFDRSKPRHINQLDVSILSPEVDKVNNGLLSIDDGGETLYLPYLAEEGRVKYRVSFVTVVQEGEWNFEMENAE